MPRRRFYAPPTQTVIVTGFRRDVQPRVVVEALSEYLKSQSLFTSLNEQCPIALVDGRVFINFKSNTSAMIAVEKLGKFSSEKICGMGTSLYIRLKSDDGFSLSDKPHVENEIAQRCVVFLSC